jgi:hypothetical protein
VHSVRVTEVQLAAVGQTIAFESDDIDEFLKQLAADPERLGIWFGSAAAGDPATFADGLMELQRAAGPSGHRALLEGLAQAFRTQSAECAMACSRALDSGPCAISLGDVRSSRPGGHRDVGPWRCLRQRTCCRFRTR